MGPRASLTTPDADKPLIIYGDETAIAMAASLVLPSPSGAQLLAAHGRELPHRPAALLRLGG